MLEFRLLGPVEVWAGEHRCDAGPPQQRLVLAVLLADAGRVVPAETLISRLWDDDPPMAARRGLHAHIARIRRMLRESTGGPAGRSPGSDRDRPILAGVSGGYRLDVDSDLVDMHRYRRLTAPERNDQAALTAAIRLWRGVPLLGLPGRWAAETRDHLSRRHRDTVVAWSRTADPGPAADLLTGLVDDHQFDEPLAAALVRVLHRAGRTADALELLRRTRQVLVAELGVEPGPELAGLQREILVAAEPDLPPLAPPPQVPAFAGRHAELARLDAVADRPVLVLTGTAGVGKSTLAMRWAARVADRFPDGVLYADLRGFGAGPAATVAETVRGFLQAFDVPPQAMPVTEPARLARYRRLLTGRRVLVLLDNARDAEQVRRLLPRTPGCLALVTSRYQLPALTVTEGAYPLVVDLLDPAESRQLLAVRLGADRVAAEPRAVDEIIERCARLPLALAVFAARAAAYRQLTLTALVSQLRAAEVRLDALSSTDPSVDLRTVFSWSYDRLAPATARLFRLLGTVPGPDITAEAAAALLGATGPAAAAALAELADAHLVVTHPDGRFAVHDLLRAYAVEHLDEDPAEPARRLLDFYLHSAYAADGLLYPHRDDIALPSLPAGIRPWVFADAGKADTWLAAERAVLLAAVDHAHTTGFAGHAYGLALCLVTALDRHGCWDDLTAVLHTAARIARDRGDAAGHGQSLRLLGLTAARLGRYAEATALAEQALAVHTTHRNPTGQARTHRDLANLSWHTGDRPGALHHLRAMLRLSETAGLAAGPAFAHYAAACVAFLTGDPETAVARSRAAVDAYRQLGDRVGEAVAWAGRGLAHTELGHPRSALLCHRRALSLRRATGERYLTADSLRLIGAVHATQARPGEARRAWWAAYEILSELGHPDADQVKAQLADLP